MAHLQAPTLIIHHPGLAREVQEVHQVEVLMVHQALRHPILSVT